MDFGCQQCGKPKKSSYYIPEVASVLVREQLCSKCYFWEQILAHKDDPHSLRLDGVQYWYLDGEAPPPFNGFDGERCDFSSGGRLRWDRVRSPSP